MKWRFWHRNALEEYFQIYELKADYWPHLRLLPAIIATVDVTDANARACVQLQSESTISNRITRSYAHDTHDCEREKDRATSRNAACRLDLRFALVYARWTPRPPAAAAAILAAERRTRECGGARLQLRPLGIRLTRRPTSENVRVNERR